MTLCQIYHSGSEAGGCYFDIVRVAGPIISGVVQLMIMILRNNCQQSKGVQSLHLVRSSANTDHDRPQTDDNHSHHLARATPASQWSASVAMMAEWNNHSFSR